MLLIKSTHNSIKVFRLLFLIAYISANFSFAARPPPPNQIVNPKEPYVTFYGNEYHRGGWYFHYLKRECTNLPEKYEDWASSMDTHGRCVSVCEHKNCEGHCALVHQSKGIERLQSVGLNDKVSSIKFCYSFLK